MTFQFANLSSERANLRIGGDEAHGFLNNLLTSDVANEGNAAFCGLLSPQGKILFDMIVLTYDTHLIINVARDQETALLKRLLLYKLRAKIELEVLSHAETFVSWGSDKACGFSDPRVPTFCAWHIGPKGERMREGEELPASEWHKHRALLGIPLSGVDFDFGGAFPHDVNMDFLNGVDFAKGCYVGQEVVSRMKHRGTARKRTMIVSNADHDFSPGDVMANARAIGTVLNTYGNHGLCVIRLDKATSALESGMALTLNEIPVTLTKPDYAQFEWPLANA